jgi:hypothetical protein
LTAIGGAAGALVDTRVEIQDLFDPTSGSRQPFQPRRAGYRAGMELSLLLIVIGIVLAVLVNYGLGIVCILIGLVLLIWPRLRASV